MQITRNRFFDKSILLHILVLCLLVVSQKSLAAGISIVNASTTLSQDVFYLTAQVNYKFSDELVDALHRGIPITIAVSIEINQSRDYVWDSTIATLEQRYQIAYHELTEQYIVRNLNSGSQLSFADFKVATSVMGTIVSLPVIDKNLLVDDEKYYGNIQVQVDVDTLPVPLRLLSYVSSGWQLSSGWYKWSLEF
ncbi:MAG: DUF4390 domain-containing protein [Gammaproteobacteria bacterium]